MTTSSTIKLLKVSTQFEPYIDSALKRLIYLHEGVDFVFKDGFIFVSFSERIDLASLKSEAAHALYREKIFQETIPMRRSIYSRIFGE